MCEARYNLARLDLVSIKLAVLCEELGSFSSAARSANMSVSRASRRLNGLEAAIGRSLLRHCNGLTPTDYGRVLASYGRKCSRPSHA